MSKPLHESVTTLAEATTGASDDTGLLEVEFITPGWGSSGYYSRAVVESAAPLFAAGTQMYFDHASATERADRPERSVRDIAAVIAEAGTVSPITGGIRGKVRPLKAYTDLLTDETFAKNVGLSISGSATDITVGEAEGRTGPIIEGLAALDSVDFVTRAGRGGRVLAVMESAGVDVSEATAHDRLSQVRDAVRAAFPRPGAWTYVHDIDAEADVAWFTVERESEPSVTYEQGYSVGANDVDVELVGSPTEVRHLTTYVPVTRPGSTNTATESLKEDTMPQIEEARLRELEEASGRVPTLESERDTAVQERDQFRAERDQYRARESAVTHARARVTEANASLPSATVDRIVAEATRAIPLTEAGQLDTAALDATVDTARTAEETYLAGLAESAGVGSISGFGSKAQENDKSFDDWSSNFYGKEA